MIETMQVMLRGGVAVRGWSQGLVCGWSQAVACGWSQGLVSSSTLKSNC